LIMKNFSIIVAMDQNRGIGKGGKLPWSIPDDMKYFKKVTTATEEPSKCNAVIMGRITWESIPDKFRPLKGRVNIVITRNKNFVLPQGVKKAESLTDALKLIDDTVESVFVIGGGQIYHEAIQMPECRTICSTEIDDAFDCDVVFSSIRGQFC